jgi:hypothetical protein
MIALIFLRIYLSLSVDDIDFLYLDLVKYCGSYSCYSDNDSSYLLIPSFGFILSNSEKYSCTFLIIGTSDDGNSGVVYNFSL